MWKLMDRVADGLTAAKLPGLVPKAKAAKAARVADRKAPKRKKRVVSVPAKTDGAAQA